MFQKKKFSVSADDKTDGKTVLVIFCSTKALVSSAKALRKMSTHLTEKHLCKYASLQVDKRTSLQENKGLTTTKNRIVLERKSSAETVQFKFYRTTTAKILSFHKEYNFFFLTLQTRAPA